MRDRLSGGGLGGREMVRSAGKQANARKSW
jgi:hypothetical protein